MELKYWILFYYWYFNNSEIK